MTYIEWNTAIADHFFSEANSGNRIFLCVTSDTLEEISGLSPQRALEDFVAAVKLGPEWTQISGCNRVGSKARTCLFPDPQWRSRASRTTEKKDLTGQIHWEQFSETESGKPPYIAYLSCFVLAWTERSAGFSSNNYYGPLNSLLELQGNEQLNTSPDFGPYYSRDSKDISMLDLWRDLERWGFANNAPVCYLPPELAEAARYVDIPKYFGLLKAKDLKNLGNLFALLEDAGTLSPDRQPTPAEMVRMICDFRRSPNELSPTCLSNLQSAITLNDSGMVNAYGTLLCDKYRHFDGVFVDDSAAGNQGAARCKAKLLRVLDHKGKLLIICRLRKDNAWEKLSLESGVKYTFAQVGNSELTSTAAWVASTPWFTAMEISGNDAFAAARFKCSDFSLSAGLLARQIVFMRNWGLPYHLQGCYVEADEIEPAKNYFVLTAGTGAPVVTGLTFTPFAARVPDGVSCWKTRVPENLATWPTDLPPLTEDKPKEPSIRLEGFRLEPRSNRFSFHFPPTIYPSDDALEVFMAHQPENCGIKLQNDNGIYTLIVPSEGTVTLALRCPETKMEFEGCRKELELVDIGRMAPCGSCAPLLWHDGDTPPPPYPAARICAEGGTPDPHIPPAPITFLASDPPKLRIEASPSLLNIINLRVNKLETRIPANAASILPHGKVGVFDLECCWNNIVLDRMSIGLVQDPTLKITGLSEDEQSPALFSDQIIATVHANGGNLERLEGTYLITEGGSVLVEGRLHVPHVGIITSASVDGLSPGNTYRIQFKVGNKVAATRWFRIRERLSGINVKPELPTRSTVNTGFTPFAAAFKNWELPNTKGGKRE
jgi:hypothetical protein